MKWFWKSREKRAPLEFEDAVCFNWALDTNRELQEGLLKLAEQYPHLTEERYTQRLLELFQRAGLELSADELKILLMLRRETDCMLLRKEQEKTQKDFPKDTLQGRARRNFMAAEASAGHRGRRPIRRRGGFHIRPGTFLLPHTATGDQCSPLHIKIGQESDSLTCIFCDENALFVACVRELPYNGSRSREGR